jgi:PTH1 family peptidyl-tRNA hydrolase
MNRFLIAGLGNLGEEYSGTRHNIGFDVVDELARRKDVKFITEKLASVTEFKEKGKSFFLIKPTTYMNLSGKAVAYWMQDQKIHIQNILIVLDDLALPLGSLRIRPKGSNSGHNGLKNIDQILHSQNYARLRFGIGNDFAKGRQVEFVLGKWKAEELSVVEKSIQRGAEAIISFGLSGLQNTMNEYNS